MPNMDVSWFNYKLVVVTAGYLEIDSMHLWELRLSPHGDSGAAFQEHRLQEL